MTDTNDPLADLPAQWPQRARDAVTQCAQGKLPPNIALTWLAVAGLGAPAIGDVLDELATQYAERGAEREAHFLSKARHLLPDAQNFADIAAIASEHDAPAVESDAVAHWAAVFDKACTRSPEASVALYSLGRPALLRAATDEVVAWMGKRKLLAPGHVVLDVGCGIGRFLRALAPQVRAVVGIEIAPAMAIAARTRTHHLKNTMVVRTSGRDLAMIRDGSIDLMLAVDVFPYLVKAGLAEDHVAEAVRVLKPSGSLVVLNWSYDGDLAADRADSARLAAQHGFTLASEGEREFHLWDAAVFHLCRGKVRQTSVSRSTRRKAS